MGLFQKSKQNKFYSPIDGKVKQLSFLKDGVFSKKMLGDGLVVCFSKDTKKGEVYSPVSGRLVTVFPTKHAYGIRMKSGTEVLVHIGIDTINLKGSGFTSHVHQGAKVKAGALLATIDLENVRSKVPSTDPIVLITSGEEISYYAEGTLTTNDELFRLK